MDNLGVFILAAFIVVILFGTVLTWLNPVEMILLGVLGLLVIQGVLMAVVWVICKVLDVKDGR